ncbi:MAG TPA: vitamin B12 dependent-methionine synthase activation domain-containing protein [Spirochaetota bacterium]|nr:vitamin B12 dependent-methionine synthase activation domain-containing protein [Spirochaetota bacterium]
MNHLKNIPLSIPYKEIYARLGYSVHKTSLQKSEKDRIDAIIRDGFSLCNFQGIYKQVKVLSVTQKGFVLESGHEIESVYLKDKLKEYGSMIMMAASAGRIVTETVTELMKKGDNGRAVIYDATASESADAVLDYLQKHIKMQFARSGMAISRLRYSPGYGDIDLSVQKIIYDILELQDYGIILTEYFQLIPEKSVLAIAGLS